MAKNDYYSIAAKPTRYDGVLYRSRLEARWAAFFDFMGYEFEYEPEPFTTWSPDFLLQAIGGIYLEIKPQGLWSAELMDKITPYCFIHRCGLFSEDVTFDDNQFYLGKLFNKNYEKDQLLLKDLGVPYHWRFDRRTVSNLWKESQNKVMYLKPE